MGQKDSKPSVRKANQKGANTTRLLEPSQSNKNIIQTNQKQLTNHQPQINYYALTDQMIIQGEILYKLSEKEVKEFPHNLIGAITGKNFNNDSVRGSGSLIASNLVLTVAHCIFDGKYGGQYKELKFFPAVYSVLNDQDGIKFESWRYLQDFKKLPRRDLQQYDYALVKLVDKVPRQLYLKPTFYCQSCLLNKGGQKQLKIVGYPFNKSQYLNYIPLSLKISSFQIFQYGLQKPGAIKQIIKERGLIYYKISTEGGQSGSPLIYGGVLIGTHNGGNEEKQLNGGRLLDRVALTNITKWGQQLKGDSINIGETKECLHSIKQINRKIQSAQKPDTKLDVSYKGLTELRLEEYTNLRELTAYGNKLLEIKLDNNTQLTELWLSNNQLSQLDLSNNTQITYLSLNENRLSLLDLSKNTQLTELQLNYNQLQLLDLSKNTQITQLKLSNNQLSLLDLSKNTQLTFLSLDNNQLSLLDLSKSTQITYLSLNDNQLLLLDLSKHTKLRRLLAKGNRLQRVEFIFSQGMPWGSNIYQDSVDLSDQQSGRCEVTVLFRNDTYKKCDQFLKYGRKGFKEGKEEWSSNKHKCEYLLQTRQIK